MIYKVLLISNFILLTFFTGSPVSNPTGIEEQWSTPPSLKVPESVLYDEEREVLYVSNINGKPTEKNGKGFLSKLTLTGEIGESDWITGLDAPKGMNISGSKLFVTDIDELVIIDIDSGEKDTAIKAKEAEFLNDIAVGNDGEVYVSDMRKNRIYRYKNGSLKTWLKGDFLNSVNGLYFKKKRLIAGTASNIISIDPESKERKELFETPASVDGVKGNLEDGILFSDWEGRVYYHNFYDGTEKLLDTRGKGVHAADIEFIPSMDLLLVPTFFDNRVFAYKLTF